MKLSHLSVLSLDKIKRTSYYANLPKYLKEMSPPLSDNQIRYEIAMRYHPKNISGNIKIRESINTLKSKGYYHPNLLRQVRVFYPHYLPENKLEDFLTRIPQICTDGDRNVVLPNSDQIGADQIPNYGLLGYYERRLARKKVIASPNLLFGLGGYPRSGITYVNQPYQIIVLSMAGNQFEFDKLEYQDFIVDERKTIRNSNSTLFPQFYPHSQRRLSTMDEIKSHKNKISPYYHRIDSDHYLDKQALLLSMIEDVYLLLTSFCQMIPEGKYGWLHATAMGAGFFSHFLKQKDIGSVIYQTLLKAHEVVLNLEDKMEFERSLIRKKLRVIIFPDFTSHKYYTPETPNFGLNWIKCMALKKDALDFEGVDRSKYTLGVINPGDAFAIPGNEFSYSSVESMIGNNTDLRLMQNYHWNPYLTKRSNWKKVTIPDPFRLMKSLEK